MVRDRVGLSLKAAARVKGNGSGAREGVRIWERDQGQDRGEGLEAA